MATIFSRILSAIVLLWGRLVERAIRKGAFERAEFFVEKIKLHLKAGSLLDLGCGTLHIGALLKQKLSLDVHAVDTQAHWGYIGEWLIGLPCARFLARKYSILLTPYDGECLSDFADGHFDTVLVAFALHHAKNPGAVLAEAIRVSRGRVILLEDTPETDKERRINHVSDAVVNLELGGPDNGRTKEEWRQTFLRLGVRLVHEESWTSKMGLLTFFNTMFVLEK